MAENAATPKSFIGGFIMFVVLWLLFMKGGELYTNYKMIKDVDEKIAFMKKNNANWFEMCSQYRSAIRMATTVKNQEKYDEYRNAAIELHCET